MSLVNDVINITSNCIRALLTIPPPWIFLWSFTYSTIHLIYQMEVPLYNKIDHQDITSSLSSLLWIADIVSGCRYWTSSWDGCIVGYTWVLLFLFQELNHLTLSLSFSISPSACFCVPVLWCLLCDMIPKTTVPETDTSLKLYGRGWSIYLSLYL